MTVTLTKANILKLYNTHPIRCEDYIQSHFVTFTALFTSQATHSVAAICKLNLFKKIVGNNIFIIFTQKCPEITQLYTKQKISLVLYNL